MVETAVKVLLRSLLVETAGKVLLRSLLVETRYAKTPGGAWRRPESTT